MSITALSSIQRLKVEGAVEAESKGRESMGAAIADHQARAAQAYEAGMRHVEEKRAAREILAVITAIGTIVGSMGVGTALGMGFGEACNEIDENEANDAKRDTDRADQLTKLAEDAFSEARDNLDQLHGDTRTAEATGRDLREHGWVGIG